MAPANDPAVTRGGLPIAAAPGAGRRGDGGVAARSGDAEGGAGASVAVMLSLLLAGANTLAPAVSRSWIGDSSSTPAGGGTAAAVASVASRRTASESDVERGDVVAAIAATVVTTGAVYGASTRRPSPPPPPPLASRSGTRSELNTPFSAGRVPTGALPTVALAPNPRCSCPSVRAPVDRSWLPPVRRRREKSVRASGADASSSTAAWGRRMKERGSAMPARPLRRRISSSAGGKGGPVNARRGWSMAKKDAAGAGKKRVPLPPPPPPPAPDP